MKKALRQLIDALDRVFETDEEVGDTMVREAMADAVQRAFVAPEAGYVLPAEFGMFSPAGNAKVRRALERFLAHPEVVAAGKALRTPKERLEAFQDPDVESKEGNGYDE